jgi:1-acyl-sn-glycerol-3-phosphate acyltransferase
MFDSDPLVVSQAILGLMGVRMFKYYQDRIPQNVPTLIVSNHRSFLDAPVLIEALDRPVSIACHHYLGQAPVLKEFVHLLGCIPLDKPEQRQKNFFKKATELLQVQRWVGIFPEGGEPMVELTKPREVGKFQRGFAHLAFQVPVPTLAVLPIAIVSTEEIVNAFFPIRLLQLFDPSEPLFDRPGLHPVAFYRNVNVLIGNPYFIDDRKRQQYRGKGGKKIVTELTEYCHREITALVALK